MKDTFYDVKKREKVQAEVIDKVEYGKPGNKRFAFRAKTPDGRNLTKFVKKEVYEKAKI